MDGARIITGSISHRLCPSTLEKRDPRKKGVEPRVALSIFCLSRTPAPWHIGSSKRATGHRFVYALADWCFGQKRSSQEVEIFAVRAEPEPITAPRKERGHFFFEQRKKTRQLAEDSLLG